VLLGVDYDYGKNDMKFLIMSAHYEGNLQPKQLIEKGFISWQESSFFLRDAFYNFCFPKAKYLKSGIKSLKTANF
jgi:hypothetical protein